MVWTLRHTVDDLDDACRKASALRQQGYRVQVKPFYRKQLEVLPEVISETREWRQKKNGEMSDLADAKKRYKSPG